MRIGGALSFKQGFERGTFFCTPSFCATLGRYVEYVMEMLGEALCIVIHLRLNLI